jgi:integrative and conjugative element protein (TIGR02256 family)
MTVTYINFGEPLGAQQPDALVIDAARQTISAIQAHADYELIEMRQLADSELLIVDCVNDGVPSRNKIGIQYRERLVLRYFNDPEIIPEVRALRINFPTTFHQNSIFSGEPCSLCIYFEPWSAIQRTWTPQKHLARIQWWLVNMANGTLHAEEQPLEPLYFDSLYELVLPPNFDEKVCDDMFSLIVNPRPITKNNFKILVGEFVFVADAKNITNLPLSCEALSIPPITHGQIEATPGNLGQLDDQFKSRGVDLAEIFFEKIRIKAEGNGLGKTQENLTLLVLNIPLTRDSEAVVEKTQRKGFLLHANIGQLGEKAGVLYENEGRYWQIQLVGQNGNASDDWREVSVEPIDVTSPLTRELARNSSGMPSEGPNGVLAGVGAIGSSIANIWHRQGWGVWTLIDHDIVKPHNLARHSTFEFQVGRYKVNAVRELENSIYPTEPAVGEDIAEQATNYSSEKVTTALDTAALVVDATTTLEVPRDLSFRDSVQRVVSVFITPSGLGSVMMLEDAHRAFRLDVLEAQYYRAIINCHWGNHHLRGHQGGLWVGAGCRDVSAVIPNELVQLHGATLARHVRLKSEQQEAGIFIWHCDQDSGALEAVAISPEPSCAVELDGLSVIWDEGTRAAVQSLRMEQLPNETGGVLLGYFDLQLSRVYVVEALPAPTDSQGDMSGFTRGIAGLKDAVRTAQDRTANIVGYIGEWHSHPSGTTSQPSSADIYLLKSLASELHSDGLPALMLIVGEEGEWWLAGEAKD